jgi:hypothetical protein
MDMVGMAVALVVGIGIGFGVAKIISGKPEEASTPDHPDWFKIRQTLTGTQLQILQYMEAKKEVSITGLQEKFSSIPDRELYYRLEQIVLMGFLGRERKEGEVYYVLNSDYSHTVEDDKTIMLSVD